MRLILLMTTLLLLATTLQAETFKPAILFNSKLIMDKSFNEALFNGMELFKEKTGVAYEKGAEPDQAVYEKKLRQFVQEGFNPILTPGNSNKDIIARVAEEHPDTFFITVDYVLEKKNVYSILFKEHEGTFLAGIMAGMATQSNTIGFIGGMDIPVIRRFSFGFEQGVRYVNPEAKVIIDFVQGANDPWNSPEKGKQIAQAQLKQGADVIFPAAGGTGTGALEAAAQAGKLGVGVDSNQNHLFPGHVLTSVVKNLERAVYIALFSYQKRLWSDNIKRLGIAQKGVAVVIDEHNQSLVSQAMREKLEQARMEILMGTLVIHSDKVGKTENSTASTQIKKPKVIQVATTSEDIFPNLMGDKLELDAEKPGLAVEVLRLVEQNIDVKFQYKRLPYRRAIVNLKQGKMDAFIYANYSPELEESGVYPKQNNKLDVDRRLLTERWNLYQMHSSPFVWNGNPTPEMGRVGAVVGAAITKDLEADGIYVESTKQLLSSFLKMTKGRVDLVAAVDLNGDYLLKSNPENLANVVKLEPELAKKYYYMLFSQQFYHEYPQYSEIIWNTISEMRESVEFWERIDRYFE